MLIGKFNEGTQKHEYIEEPFNEIYEAIKADEHYNKLNNKSQNFLDTICEFETRYGQFDQNDFGWLETQAKISSYYIKSDLESFKKLGYISEKTMLDDKTRKPYKSFQLGSQKFRDKITTKEWKIEFSEIKRKRRTYLKFRLNSVVDLKKYKGWTVEEILKKDPEYIKNGLKMNAYIMSLTTIEIIEKRFGLEIPDRIKNRLELQNELHKLATGE
ncbi:hypothetical protein [Winogradskyella sp. 4-2091]|uniref:hypothetical protein n=1 Tax=Winogradskyella sp. 4-2091 TaxID=3381659 RepID=UPI00389289D9